jgi:multidrug efflux pump subunit AcrA (membrane-fusion protein)
MAARARFWIVVTAAILLVMVCSLFLACGHRSPAAKSTSSVSNRSSQFIRLKGTTEAVESRAILAPLLAGQQVSTLTIVRMAAAGSRVKKGDLLVEFDRQAQTRDFVDKQAEYEKARRSGRRRTSKGKCHPCKG